MDSKSVGAGSIDPAGMVDALIKSLNTEPIDCSNFVARSESATNPFEGDASKIATVSETKSPVTIRSRNGKEWLDFCTDYDKIDPSYENSYEYHVANCGFAFAVPTLILEWLEPGEELYVNEYSGYETIVIKSNFKSPPWHVAYRLGEHSSSSSSSSSSLRRMWFPLSTPGQVFLMLC